MPAMRTRPSPIPLLNRRPAIHLLLYGIWILFLLWLIGIASHENRSWILELGVESDDQGVSVLYFDSGNGFTPAENAQFPLIKGKQTLQFPLPPGPVSALRWDPLSSTGSTPAHFAIHSIAIRDPRSNRSPIHPADAVTPLSGIDNWISGKHSTVFRIPSATNDPNLLILLPPSLLTDGALMPPGSGADSALPYVLIAVLVPLVLMIPFQSGKKVSTVTVLALLSGIGFPSTPVQAQGAPHPGSIDTDSLKSWALQSNDGQGIPSSLPVFEIDLNLANHEPIQVAGPFTCPSTIQVFLECGRLPSGFRFCLSETNPSATPHSLDLFPRPQTKRNWRLLHWTIPRNWQSKAVTLSVVSEPWADVIRVSPPLHLQDLHASASVGASSFLLWVTGIPFQFILLCIPGWAAALILIRKPALGPCFAFPIAWVLTLAIQYPILGAAFLNPRLASILSWTILCLSSWILIRYSAKAIRFWKHNADFRDQIALFALATFTTVAVGCLTGGWDDSLSLAAGRYLKQMLPADQLLPMLVADRLHLGMPLKPFFLEWLSSDRPPLSSAPVLFQYPFFTDRPTQYHILSIILQASVIPCSHCLLRATGAGRLLASGIAAALAMSGTFLLHSFYVWPKALPAGLLLIIAALLFGRDANRLSLACRRPGTLLVGMGTALSFLSHGGSIFAAFPMFLIWAMLRPFKHIPTGLLALLPFMILMLPWSLYQKHYDPPGDRLLKWHLAGIPELTSEPFSDAFVRRYKEMSLEEWLQIRKSNIQLLWGNWALTFHNLHPLQTVMGFPQIRLGSFLHHFQSLGIWLLGYLAAPWAIIVSLRRRQTALPLLFLVSIAGLFLWTCLIFRPGQAIVHHGSLFFQFTGMILGAWCIHLVSSRLLRLCFFINALLWFVIWVWPHWWVAHLPGARYDTIRSDPLALTLLIITLAGWTVFLSHLSTHPRSN